MTHTYYACSALLLVLSIYRPFITKLDRVKYLLFGTIAFMLPFAALLENEKINIEANTVNKNNTLSALSLYMSPNMTWIVNSQNYSEIILSDALVLALLTAITITLCGLLSRWQFSILFVQPKSNVYISGFTRYGVSTALGCLGLLRYSNK
jgi:hypothetical protein